MIPIASEVGFWRFSAPLRCLRTHCSHRRYQLPARHPQVRQREQRQQVRRVPLSKWLDSLADPRFDVMLCHLPILVRQQPEERERTREAQVNKLAAQKRELVARKEAYRWKLITALGVIAGLAITAITAA